jgi:hypothetical protein
MNERHLVRCASVEWQQLVEGRLLPWVLGEDGLGGLPARPAASGFTDVLVESDGARFRASSAP